MNKNYNEPENYFDEMDKHFQSKRPFIAGIAIAIIILICLLASGCSKDEGYTLKKYHYKVYGYGINCDAILVHDGITEDLNQSSDAIEFDSRKSFEVTFSPKGSNHYTYDLYVERENTWHQKEHHNSFNDGYYTTPKTYIVK